MIGVKNVFGKCQLLQATHHERTVPGGKSQCYVCEWNVCDVEGDEEYCKMIE